jgi:hypothetical protein
MTQIWKSDEDLDRKAGIAQNVVHYIRHTFERKKFNREQRKRNTVVRCLLLFADS